MEALEKNQIDIDRYLMGQMAREEEEQFMDRMKADKELADQLADTELALEIIDAAEDRALKDRLVSLENEEFKVTDKQNQNLRVLLNTEKTEAQAEAKVVQLNPLRRYLSIAASVLLFLAAAWFLLRPSSLSNQDLFAENFSPYPNSEVLDRGSVDDRQAAYFAYQSGDFEQAYELLTDLPADAGNQFFAAQAAMATDRFSEALELLNPLAANSDFVLQQESEWQLALAHLQLDEREAAQAILREISRDNDHSRQRDATVLLTKF
ncbi:MAG: hypothetical protein AAFY36_12030 [Bacteroidota bacterium]